MISLDEISDYLAKHGNDLFDILTKIELKIVRGREEGVPIYLTKCRVKKPHSAYLKTKRKQEIRTLEDMNDLAGIRVICLFEQDLLPTFEFLLTKILTPEYTRTVECEIYGFPSEQAKIYKDHQGWEGHIRHGLDAKNIKIVHKESKYQSIHVICHFQAAFGRTYRFELQLRTLLQDVWGELEHALAYKQGNQEGHVRQIFNWFHNDLDNVGRMLSELKESRDREQGAESFFSKIAPLRRPKWNWPGFGVSVLPTCS